MAGQQELAAHRQIWEEANEIIVGCHRECRQPTDEEAATLDRIDDDLFLWINDLPARCRTKPGEWPCWAAVECRGFISSQVERFGLGSKKGVFAMTSLSGDLREAIMQQRRRPTLEERARLDKLGADMAAIYEPAWREANR